MAVITESFNKADSGTLGPDLTWTEVAGVWDVVSNTARLTSGLPAMARADTDLSGTDLYAQVTVQSQTATTSAAGVVVRAPGTSNVTGYYAIVSWNNGDFITAKVVNGSETHLDETPMSFSLNTNYTVRLEVEGDNIRSFFDGDPVADLTDTEITTGVRTGIFGLKAGSPTIIFENFEGGDISAWTPETDADETLRVLSARRW